MIIQLLGGVRAAVFAGLFLVASLWGGWGYFQKSQLEDKLERVETQAAAKRASYLETIRGITYDYHVEKDQREEYVDRLQSDVASGKRLLKQRFSCPAGPSTGSDGGEERGLRTEDAGFLIGEAARADEVTRQLQLAQETIRQYQELNND